MADPDQEWAPSRHSNRVASRSVPAGTTDAARARSAAASPSVSRSPQTRVLDVARAASVPAPPSPSRSPPTQAPVAEWAPPSAARNPPTTALGRSPPGLPAARSLASGDTKAQEFATAKVLSLLPSPQSSTSHAPGPAGLPFTVPRRSRYQSPQKITAPVQIPTNNNAPRQTIPLPDRSHQLGAPSSSGRREDGTTQSLNVLHQARRASSTPPAPLVRSSTAPQSSIIYKPQPRYQYQMTDEFFQQIGALASPPPSGLAAAQGPALLDRFKHPSEKREGREPSRAVGRSSRRSLSKGARPQPAEGHTPKSHNIVDASLHREGASDSSTEAMMRNKQADLARLGEQLGGIQQDLAALEAPLYHRFQGSQNLGWEAQEEINKRISREVANVNQLRQANRPNVAMAGMTEALSGGGPRDDGSGADPFRLVALQPPGPRVDDSRADVSQGLKFDSDDKLRRQDWVVAKLGPANRGHHPKKIIAQILAWKERHESVQTISEQTGVPIGKIYDWWRLSRDKFGPTRALEYSIIPQQILDGLSKVRAHRNNIFDNKTVAQVLVWKAEGETTSAICIQTGLIESSVNKWWRDYRHVIFGGLAQGAEAMQE